MGLISAIRLGQRDPNYGRLLRGGSYNYKYPLVRNLVKVVVVSKSYFLFISNNKKVVIRETNKNS